MNRRFRPRPLLPLVLFFSGLVYALGGASATMACVGDCNGDGAVTVDELVRGLQAGLGTLSSSLCPSLDADTDGVVAVDEIVRAVRASVLGCPGCGNGVVEAGLGEECDDGMMCVAGSVIPETPVRCDTTAACGPNGTCLTAVHECAYAIPCRTNAQCGAAGHCAPVGGDGCAPNCTSESVRVETLDGATSGVTVNSLVFPVPSIEFNGTRQLRSGKPSPRDVQDPSGALLFHAGDIPVVAKAVDVTFQPIDVLGLACACLRAHPYAPFGPGNATAGVIACSDGGLSGNDFAHSLDHHVGQVGIDGFTADDCAAAGGHLEVDGGVCTDNVCVGGLSGQPCVDTASCNDPHPGTCNGPLITQTSGGPAGAGSARLSSYQSNTQLVTDLACEQDLTQPAWGADGIPCTPDDRPINAPTLGTSTTGRATAQVLHANDGDTAINTGSEVACDKNHTNCAAGERCFDRASIDAGGTALCKSADVSSACLCLTTCKSGGSATPCQVVIQGSNFDCEALAASPTGGLAGGALVSAVPGLHTSSQSGDTVAIPIEVPQ